MRRWLGLLAACAFLGVSVPALALPYPEAEAAYARGDYAAAFKLWLPLAEQGSARAQEQIARMYERGEWVAQDKAMAQQWHATAAAQRARDAAMPPPGSVGNTAQPVQGNVAGASTVAPTSAAPSYAPATVYRPLYVVVRHHHHHHSPSRSHGGGRR